MSAFTPSSEQNPCPVCDRTKDGDCRILDFGLVLCHTIRNGVAPGKQHPDRPYVYCGHSDEAQGFGKWKPEHLCIDLPAKAPRKYGIRYFDYFFWDGTPCPVQRYRKDVEGQPKEVKWCKGGLKGRPQLDVAPYLWEKIGDAKQIFVVRGELKAELLAGKGFTAISLLNQKDELLAAKLQAMRANGIEIVLVPDCDKADLDKWFMYLSSEVPGVKQLLAPGFPWENPPADGGRGIEDWIYEESPSNEQILAAISNVTKGEKDTEEYSWSELLDLIISAIKDRKEDEEMIYRAELKNRFRVSDEKIGAVLIRRFSENKVKQAQKKHNSLSLADVDQLEYLMDGWIPKGDLCLSYGSYGTGKTTLAIHKAYSLAKGLNILDRDKPCTPAKSLIIATDSGAAALKKSMVDIGLDPDNDPIFQPGHPEQMIYIWAYEPSQGHEAWVCNIYGVIRLEQFIEEENIQYVVIDSAKSVTSAAEWSYTSNESVKVALKHLREGICQPTGCCIEFLSHDGTQKGSHSGAKAWAEDPSIIYMLSNVENPEGGPSAVQVQFKKDRAAFVDSRRKLAYELQEGALVLRPEVEVVGNCETAIRIVLSDALKNGIRELKTANLINEVHARFQKSKKTVENTLGSMVGSGKGNKPTPLIRPRHGFVAFSPLEIQRLSISISIGGVGEMGGVYSKSIPAQSVCQTPYDFKIGGLSPETLPAQGVCQTPDPNPLQRSASAQKHENSLSMVAKPPKPPMGVSIGGYQTPVIDSDLPQPPPDSGMAPPNASDKQGDWEVYSLNTSEREGFTQIPTQNIEIPIGNPGSADVLQKPSWIERARDMKTANPLMAFATVALNLQTDLGIKVDGRQVKKALELNP